jgi:alkylation response protein AidB-like acyl-CoA dehydrogenase
MHQELRYHPSADQLALADTISEPLPQFLQLNRVHREPDESDGTWSSLDSLGLFGIAVPEEQGGSGLGATEEALIAIELGRCLASPQVFATIGAVHAIRHREFPPIRGGARVATAYRHGDRIVLVGKAPGDLLLLREESGATIHVGVTDAAGLDNYRWLDFLSESTSVSPTIGRFDAAGILRLRLLDAAALAGLAQAAARMSVEYAGVRKQFGRAIGSFQAVKHHCANMAIAARSARDQLTFAAVAVDDTRDDASLQVDCAVLVAANAALENASTNIQIHGGIGFSDEADPHILLKRARVLIALAGGFEVTSDRIANAAIRNDS